MPPIKYNCLLYRSLRNFSKCYHVFPVTAATSTAVTLFLMSEYIGVFAITRWVALCWWICFPSLSCSICFACSWLFLSAAVFLSLETTFLSLSRNDLSHSRNDLSLSKWPLSLEATSLSLETTSLSKRPLSRNDLSLSLLSLSLSLSKRPLSVCVCVCVCVYVCLFVCLSILFKTHILSLYLFVRLLRSHSLHSSWNSLFALPESVQHWELASVWARVTLRRWLLQW